MRERGVDVRTLAEKWSGGRDFDDLTKNAFDRAA
jgi:hypothetical protein